jgi:hypothetical protein
MAGMTSKLDVRTEMKKKYPIAPLQEEKIFAEVKILWGNDKKQDTRLKDVFNRVAEAESSTYRIEVKADGSPELVAGAKITPPKALPGKRKGPIIKGDDL